MLLILFPITSFSQNILVGQEEIIYQLGETCGGFAGYIDPPYDPITGIDPPPQPNCAPWSCENGNEPWPNCYLYGADDWMDLGEKWPADGVVATLQNSNGTVTSFYPYMNGYQKFSGPLHDPRKKFIPHVNPNQFNYVWLDGVGNQYTSLYETPFDLNFSTFDTLTPGVFLKNIYRIGDDELLGILHNEKFPGPVHIHPVHYSVALAYSENGGNTWTVLGDIIKPKNDNLIVHPHAQPDWTIEEKCIGKNNIGGTPYIVINDYMYIYFNETLDGVEQNCYDGNPPEQDDPTKRRVSVARAPLTEVISKARNGEVSTWKKYSGGTWKNALEGNLGDEVITPIEGGAIDLHSDATQSVYLYQDSYLMLGVMGESIYMWRSLDGINWGNEIIIASNSVNLLRFPYFSGFSNVSKDGHKFEQEFFVYYNIWHAFSPTNPLFGHRYQIARRKIEIVDKYEISNLYNNQKIHGFPITVNIDIDIQTPMQQVELYVNGQPSGAPLTGSPITGTNTITHHFEQIGIYELKLVGTNMTGYTSSTDPINIDIVNPRLQSVATHKNFHVISGENQEYELKAIIHGVADYMEVYKDGELIGSVANSSYKNHIQGTPVYHFDYIYQSNDPFGKYVFEVKVYNNDGVLITETAIGESPPFLRNLFVDDLNYTIKELRPGSIVYPDKNTTLEWYIWGEKSFQNWTPYQSANYRVSDPLTLDIQTVPAWQGYEIDLNTESYLGFTWRNDDEGISVSNSTIAPKCNNFCFNNFRIQKNGAGKQAVQLFVGLKNGEFEIEYSSQSSWATGLDFNHINSSSDLKYYVVTLNLETERTTPYTYDLVFNSNLGAGGQVLFKSINVHSDFHSGDIPFGGHLVSGVNTPLLHQ